MPTTAHEMDARQRGRLISINLAFSERERFGHRDNHDWFTEHLDRDLVLRRASGAVAGREEYVQGLTSPANATSFIEAAILDVAIAGRLATVEAVVAVAGSRGGKSIDGQYTNRRMFVLGDDDQWRCVGWWNDAIPGRAARDGIDGAGEAVARLRPDAGHDTPAPTDSSG